MLSKKMQKALNEQITHEIQSWYAYLSMSAFLKDENLDGFADWMAKQAMEELTHARKIYDYVYDRDGSAEFGALSQPSKKFKDVLNVYEEALKHEKFITGKIDELVALARKEKDNATEVFLQWFVSEQVEEEASMTEVINKLKLAKDNPGAMFQLDRVMAERE